MIERIEHFATLTPGWDSYDGEAISPETISAAKKVVPLLESISNEQWSVFPSACGSIQFESETTTLTVWAEAKDGIVSHEA